MHTRVHGARTHAHAYDERVRTRSHAHAYMERVRTHAIGHARAHIGANFAYNRPRIDSKPL